MFFQTINDRTALNCDTTTQVINSWISFDQEGRHDKLYFHNIAFFPQSFHCCISFLQDGIFILMIDLDGKVLTPLWYTQVKLPGLVAAFSHSYFDLAIPWIFGFQI